MVVEQVRSRAPLPTQAGEDFMAHTHEFDCPICGAHLDSRKQLDQHSSKEHSQHASSPSDDHEAKKAANSRSQGQRS